MWLTIMFALFSIFFGVSAWRDGKKNWTLAFFTLNTAMAILSGLFAVMRFYSGEHLVSFPSIPAITFEEVTAMSGLAWVGMVACIILLMIVAVRLYKRIAENG